MSRIHKIIIAIFVFSILIILGFGIARWVVHRFHVFHGYLPRAMAIQSALGKYLEMKDGQFPKCEEELISEGFLKKVIEQGKTRYFWTCPDNNSQENWSELVFFEEFDIAYGASPQNIKIVDEDLVDKNTGQPVLLISGPHTKELMFLYKRISKSWYNQMLEPPNSGTN